MVMTFIMGENEEARKRRSAQIQQWTEAFESLLDKNEFIAWPNVKNPNSVEFAAVWNQPAGIFNELPNLKCISSIGAGVNHIFNDPSLPENVPVVRVTDEKLSRDMVHYVLQTVLNITRMQDYFIEGQHKKKWRQHPPFTLNDETMVGVMGLGVIGEKIARALQQLDIPVIGWSRRQKNIEGVQCYDEAAFNMFLKQTKILVCILPLTPQTTGIINQNTLKQLPRGAYVINIARGQHVVDEDLIRAIDSGYIAGAKLDVFHIEPLPSDHPFWTHPKIGITPHNAGVSDPLSCAKKIVENYRRLQAGKPLINITERSQGY